MEQQRHTQSQNETDRNGAKEIENEDGEREKNIENEKKYSAKDKRQQRRRRKKALTKQWHEIDCGRDRVKEQHC